MIVCVYCVFLQLGDIREDMDCQWQERIFRLAKLCMFYLVREVVL